jgi:hypothetical protein
LSAEDINLLILSLLEYPLKEESTVDLEELYERLIQRNPYSIYNMSARRATAKRWSQRKFDENILAVYEMHGLSVLVYLWNIDSFIRRLRLLQSGLPLVTQNAASLGVSGFFRFLVRRLRGGHSGRCRLLYDKKS